MLRVLLALLVLLVLLVLRVLLVLLVLVLMVRVLLVLWVLRVLRILLVLVAADFHFPHEGRKEVVGVRSNEIYVVTVLVTLALGHTIKIKEHLGKLCVGLLPRSDAWYELAVAASHCGKVNVVIRAAAVWAKKAPFRGR